MKPSKFNKLSIQAERQKASIKNEITQAEKMCNSIAIENARKKLDNLVSTMRNLKKSSL